MTLDSTGLKNSEEFTARLKLAIGKRSARAFALQCGLSPAGLHHYLSGRSEPTRPVLIKISQMAGVSLEWLMTGRAPMRVRQDAVMIDRETYDTIVLTVEEYLDKTCKRMALQKKIEIYHCLYELFGEEPENVLKEKVHASMPMAAVA
jgi:transcriptional regulator with XRE-family HTH domain